MSCSTQFKSERVRGRRIARGFPDAETLSTAHILAIRMRRGELPSEAAAWVRDNTNKNPTPQAIDLAMGGADLLRKLGDSPSKAHIEGWRRGGSEGGSIQNEHERGAAAHRSRLILMTYLLTRSLSSIEKSATCLGSGDFSTRLSEMSKKRQI